MLFWQINVQLDGFLLPACRDIYPEKNCKLWILITLINKDLCVAWGGFGIIRKTERKFKKLQREKYKGMKITAWSKCKKNYCINPYFNNSNNFNLFIKYYCNILNRHSLHILLEILKNSLRLKTYFGRELQKSCLIFLFIAVSEKKHTNQLKINIY